MNDDHRRDPIHLRAYLLGESGLIARIRRRVAEFGADAQPGIGSGRHRSRSWRTAISLRSLH